MAKLALTMAESISDSFWAYQKEFQAITRGQYDIGDHYVNIVILQMRERISAASGGDDKIALTGEGALGAVAEGSVTIGEQNAQISHNSTREIIQRFDNRVNGKCGLILAL